MCQLFIFFYTSITNLRAYEENGDFYCSANVVDSTTGVVNSWIILKDEGGTEKRFECENINDIALGVWSDISGLWTSGRYTITLYAQDNAGNKGCEVLHDVVVAEVSSGPKKIYLSVGEEKEVNISINTLFKTEPRNHIEKTDEGMKAKIKSNAPGCSMFRFEWSARNNLYETEHNYDIYVYSVPQAPKITKVSNEVSGYDVIVFEPVAYAKTYELYRKRVGIDSDYQLWDEVTDNKSHTTLSEHTDENVVYWYALCAKAEESIDLSTNEKYFPKSNFSNNVSSSGEGQTEEGGSEDESSENAESSTENDLSSGDMDITDGLYISGLKSKTYTGSAVKQDIKLYYNKLLLREGVDYTLTYKDNLNVGTASLIIKAKNNLTGTVRKKFEIVCKDISHNDVIIEDMVYSYDTKEHKKMPKITYKGKLLREGKDYVISNYDKGDYTSVGTYYTEIKGIGNYDGKSDNVKTIIVDKQKNINKAVITKIPVQEYKNGKPVELLDNQIIVTLAKLQLVKDVDYTVSYINNINPGKASLIIKGKGQYAGTKKVNFTIKRTPTALTDSMVTNKKAISSVPIQKNGARPKPKLTAGSNTLLEGRDYTLSYQNNKKAGTGTIIIKGKGNYNKQLKIPFTITAKSLTSADLEIRVPDVPYTGRQNKYQSKPVITDSDGGVLVLNKDYTITSYQVGAVLLDKKSNPEEGTMITVAIAGKGSYTGTVTAVYMLKGTSFSKASIQVTTKPYTGNPVTIEAEDIISASIRMGKNQTILQFGKDYEIAAYKNNIKKGTATVIFKGKGAYSGEKTVKFRITATEIAN
ncbi:MAG: hypothetical protein K1W41_27445 [Lachnospiraceae bacterium]